MRNVFAFIATAAPLILSATGAFASEPQFRTPTTDRAQQSQALLARAARALNAGAYQHSDRGAEEHMSNLWLFPTADDDKVFAHFTLTANDASANFPASQERLELLTMKGDRIARVRDMTSAAPDGAPAAQQSHGEWNWSASIGNGHTTSTTMHATSSVGSPSSPHWSASIGTGHVSATGDVSTQPAQTATGLFVSQAPDGHWTSRIGTGHAADSSASEKKGRVQS